MTAEAAVSVAPDGLPTRRPNSEALGSELPAPFPALFRQRLRLRWRWHFRIFRLQLHEFPLRGLAERVHLDHRQLACRRRAVRVARGTRIERPAKSLLRRP